MKKILSHSSLSSKRKSIIILIASAVVIMAVSSLGAYLLTHHGQQEKRVRLAAFSKTIEEVKQQVHDATLVKQYPERDTAITKVGERLKEILASGDAALLTNKTFNNDEFSVTISDYPLQSGKKIRRVKYVLKEYETSIPAEESRFFLEFVGPKKFFSDIEYWNFHEKEFKAFENKEGCFAFALCAEPDYSTKNSDNELTDYSVDIYTLKNNKFSAPQHAEVPLKVLSSDSLKLVKHDGSIKGIVYDKNNARPDGSPECLFDGVKLSFALPKGDAESAQISYGFPGLLLGISDRQGNLRTLFVRQENNTICCSEYANQIIFPHNDTLYALKNYGLQKQTEDKYGSAVPAMSLNFRKILCVPLGADQSADLNKIFLPAPEAGLYESTDVPLYIGSDYVCYAQHESYSGGGSFHIGSTAIRFDKLDGLSKFTAQYGRGSDILAPTFEGTTLADLIYGENAKELFPSDSRTYGGKLNPYVDFNQLAIRRNLGKWSLMLPVMDDYYHPGNGSAFNSIKEFAACSDDVPAILATNSDAMKTEGHPDYWIAKDLLAFPGSSAFIGQYDYYFVIGDRGNAKEMRKTVDLRIPANPDEYIVSINFAAKDTLRIWIDELNKTR
jgi:hypothetical protein